MRAALQEDQRKGRLDASAAHDLAKTVAERELEVATGSEAVQRVQQVSLCARSLEDALEDRLDKSDRAAPLAAMALLQARLGDPDDWRSYATAQDPGWRAVGTRTLTREQDGKLRRERMLDPDEDVRLAAVRAAEVAADPSDRPVLLDCMRHDPFPLVRVTATRALAQQPAPEVVLALRDAWSQASAPLRQAIVAAWSFPGMLEQGGLRELRWAAESTEGTASIIAGGILTRLGGEVQGSGTAALLKAISVGTPQDRALAIAMAPLGNEQVFRAVQDASVEAEPKVRVAALSKLLSEPRTRARALEQLRAVAASGKPGAEEATDVLARAGDASVVPLLSKRAASPQAAERLRVADAWIAMGEFGRAAFFLADADARVRTGTACRILAAPGLRED